jgi:hypothetical protein
MVGSKITRPLKFRVLASIFWSIYELSYCLSNIDPSPVTSVSNIAAVVAPRSISQRKWSSAQQEYIYSSRSSNYEKGEITLQQRKMRPSISCSICDLLIDGQASQGDDGGGGKGVRGGQPPARSRAMERRPSSSHGELWVARPRVPTRMSGQRRRATEGRVGEGERRRTAAGRRVVRRRSGAQVGRKMSGGARDGRRAGAGGKLLSIGSPGRCYLWLQRKNKQSSKEPTHKKRKVQRTTGRLQCGAGGCMQGKTGAIHSLLC